jgi:hypothetical protein
MNSGEPGPSAAPVGVWGREKMLALLGAAALVALLLLLGLGWAVYDSIHPASATGKPRSGVPPDAGSPPGATPTGPRPAGDPVQARRDDLAARPMRAASPADAQPSVLSTRDPGSIFLPASTTAGPAGVPSGFPQTPAGALAQLAAIDKAALDSASLNGARAVIGGWAAPGGPTAATWSGIKAMADFLTAAGLSAGKAPNLALTATPVMGLVKATDGPDWVVACVDFEVDATLARTARVAVADCQRMVWEGDRWVIGPGPEPAPPPSLWPGTQAAIDAGYKDLRHG